MMIPAAAIMFLGGLVMLCKRPPLICPGPAPRVFRIQEDEPSLDGQLVEDEAGQLYRAECVGMDMDNGECTYILRKVNP